MQRTVIAATLFSFALAGSAAAQVPMVFFALAGSPVPQLAFADRAPGPAADAPTYWGAPTSNYSTGYDPSYPGYYAYSASYYAYPGPHGWGLSRVSWASGTVALKRKHVHPVSHHMK